MQKKPPFEVALRNLGCESRSPGGSQCLFQAQSLSLAAASQNSLDLVHNQRLNGVAGGAQILAGIEVGGFSARYFADSGSHSQTQVRVHVDLADGPS